MDTTTALDWLATHQYLPEDSTQDVIDGFDEVRRYFDDNPDPRCIPLLLGAFGDHMGWGIFQLCDDVFRRFPISELTPHLIDALRSLNRGTRWWAAHWAVEFFAPELAPGLEEILESRDDADAHYFAVSALGDIYQMTHDPHILSVLNKRAAVEPAGELTELLREILGDLSSAP